MLGWVGEEWVVPERESRPGEALPAVSHLWLLHCHSAYPAPTSELNLNLIPGLMIDAPDLCSPAPVSIGYSGHEWGIDPTVWAVVMGAEMVERHITLDRTMWGTDQLASVEPLAFAEMVGTPGAYDYGPERCSWLTHHLTNWMGDGGFLRRATCKIRRHNPAGDLLTFTAKVTRKYIEDGRHLVEIEQEARNQDDELSVIGTGTVELPSKIKQTVGA